MGVKLDLDLSHYVKTQTGITWVENFNVRQRK